MQFEICEAHLMRIGPKTLAGYRKWIELVQNMCQIPSSFSGIWRLLAYLENLGLNLNNFLRFSVRNLEKDPIKQQQKKMFLGNYVSYKKRLLKKFYPGKITPRLLKQRVVGLKEDEKEAMNRSCNKWNSVWIHGRKYGWWLNTSAGCPEMLENPWRK